MSIASLRYTPPIRRDLATRDLDYDLLDTACEQHQAGDHAGAIATTLRHLFPDDPPDPAAPFSFDQGSSRVFVRVEDGVCAVSVPLARLPSTGGAVAALRYTLSRINGSGQLFQAHLHGDDLVLEFRERLSSLHPRKLVEVLQRMPMEADRHDDWMIAEFGLTPLERGHVQPLDADELAVAAEVWAQHWADVEALLEQAHRKRSVWFLNELTAFAINRLLFALPLAGSLRPRLNESAGTFNDCNVDPSKREATLARFAREMRAIGADELRHSLGHVEHAIPPHRAGTPERLEEYLGPGNYMQTIERYRTTGHAIDAALALIGTYYYLLANHAWPAAIADAMKAGLAETSGKPWREAAASLMAHARGLIEQIGGDDDEHDDDESDGVPETEDDRAEDDR